MASTIVLEESCSLYAKDYRRRILFPLQPIQYVLSLLHITRSTPVLQP